MVKRIAVIGAGSAGTSVAYCLSELNSSAENSRHDSFKVVVYEEEAYSGGRAHSINFEGVEIEVGGSIIHSSNRHICELMDFVGIKRITPGLNVDGDDETLGFWNGRKIYLVCKNKMTSFISKLLLAFGPVTCASFAHYATKALKKWKNVYDIGAVATIERLVKQLKIRHLVCKSMYDYYKKHAVSKKFSKNFAEPIINNMYNQNGYINSFAAQVSLAGAGLAGGELFSIDGGNGQLFGKVLEKLQKNHKVTVNYNTKVAEIIINKSKITVVSELNMQNDDKKVVKREIFDTVVLASAIELSDIKITDNTGNVSPIKKRKMQPVFVTLVSGTLSNGHFGLAPEEIMPSTVFVKSNIGLQYNSIGITGVDKDGNRLYKIFSERKLNDELLAQLFSSYKKPKEFVWKGAFPRLEADITINPWSDFELLPNRLYYTSAIESIASTIEVSAVAGWNVADLIKEHEGSSNE
ncbi:MAG: FAD-dependent oxidoreductase [Candidatus Ancillula sp.]|nr:FAD-dependent oxidoreductase [Candidatus Ancillula sp.]